ncbi:hypothetical protein ROZALSC1DRAFT_25696, partial [Rozella allomycis CSF55]
QSYREGFLDVYVNKDLAIGFELLRGGNRLDEQVPYECYFMFFRRFDPNDVKYSKIPLKFYAILDFYEHGEPTLRDDLLVNENYYKVVFGPTFESAKVKNTHGEASTLFYCSSLFFRVKIHTLFRCFFEFPLLLEALERRHSSDVVIKIVISNDFMVKNNVF